jgi:DMSO/TMAO reductase YedYZ molybdopterin-dependent catalytic subunit
MRRLLLRPARAGLGLSLLIVVLVASLAVGCDQPSPTATPTVEPPKVVLELVGPTGAKSLTMEDLKALPAVEGWAGIKNSVGRISLPEKHRGVLLQDLCALVGGLTPDKAVEMVGADGYFMTLSYKEVVQGKLVTYDPGTGKEIDFAETLRTIIAYEREGQPLPDASDGALRFAAISARNNQIIDGHWTVKWLNKLVVKDVTRDWTLHLEGQVVEEMSKATFESGATPCCHRRIWTDEAGQIWAGIPLWHLIGRVDDEITHQAGGFNDGLAQMNYTVELVAADGYSVSFDSTRVRYNNNLILVNTLDEKPLEDKYFPLRLVGSDVQQKESIAQITSIILHLPQGVPLPTAVIPGAGATSAVKPSSGSGTVLVISGKVEKELAMTMDDLKTMAIDIKTEHPIEGMGSYSGARIHELLDKAGARADIQFAVLVSGDGARTSMPFGLLDGCPDCLAGFAYDGGLVSVMPTMDCYFWIKDLVRIELE